MTVIIGNTIKRDVLLLLLSVIIVKHRSSVSFLAVPTFVNRYNRINDNNNVFIIISSTTKTNYHITKQNKYNNNRPKNYVDTRTATTTVSSSLQQNNNEPDNLITGTKNDTIQQQQSTNNNPHTRRSFLYNYGVVTSVISSLTLLSSKQYMDDANAVVETVDVKKNTDTDIVSLSLFKTYYPNWNGTNLQIHSIQDSILPSTTTTVLTVTNQDDQQPITVWSMARWPDPILRRPADDIKWYNNNNEQQEQGTLIDIDVVQQACTILKNTARYNNAVGLAAQQCGINARIIFLEKTISTNGRSDIEYSNNKSKILSSTSNSKINSSSKNNYNNIDNDNNNNNYIIMINPRIIQRSNEINMKVWTEECLVLPSTFRATTLRDEWIQVQYQSIIISNDHNNYNHPTNKAVVVQVQTCILRGEMARAAQHELDHDRGILLTDHVPMDELENIVMKQIEQEQEQQSQQNQQPKLPNRKERTILAYTRYIQDPY